MRTLVAVIGLALACSVAHAESSRGYQDPTSEIYVSRYRGAGFENSSRIGPGYIIVGTYRDQWGWYASPPVHDGIPFSGPRWRSINDPIAE